GLSIKGSGTRVHVSVTSSMLYSGDLEFEGHFGVSSQILVAGSTLVTTLSSAIHFLRSTFGENTKLLLLDNYIEGDIYAVYLSVVALVDGGGIIVKGNTLRTKKKDEKLSSALLVETVDVGKGGYFDVENNTMSAVNGIYLFEVTTLRSAGLLRVANCTFVGRAEGFDSTLVFLEGSVTLQGGAQWRVEGNSVTAFSIISIARPQDSIELLCSGTTVVLAHNRQLEGSAFFADLALSNTIVVSPAQFVVGCNLKDGEEVSYDGVFPGEVEVFRCGTCNDDAACYMPGTESV
ncbi:dispersed gene family protein 1 (DGF-1), putative, partial [Trypanosoma cruzi marinkellei]